MKQKYVIIQIIILILVKIKVIIPIALNNKIQKN